MAEKRQNTDDDPKATVRITIHLPIETYRLLQDVALSQVLNDSAARATRRVVGRRETYTVEEVIADLVERHVAELEHSARIVRPSVRR